jgi:steroid delta-isomerase-like uncharacterized protein
MDNGAIIRRYFDEFWNQRRLEVADEIIAPEHVNHGPNDPGLGPGPESVKAVARSYLAAFPDVHFTIEQMLAEGDYVFARWSCRGVHKGELEGVAPTGKEIQVSGISLSRIAEGRIAESWNQWDALGLLRQIGAVNR